MAKEQIFMNAYMYLIVFENQLVSLIFADYISILSKLRRNTADIQGIRMDYHDKMAQGEFSVDCPRTTNQIS